MIRDLHLATVVELVTALRLRHISAVELVEIYLERIGRYNPSLNAVVTLDEEGARKQAQKADALMAKGEILGPLHGVPMTIKDSLETAGMRTTSGFPPLSEYVPTADATVVSRLKAAGAILLGKTNLPPLAGDFQTDNPIFGRTNNPWNLKYTPGGSSGGSAAAVAAGLSAFDIGSDIAGSIRVPAHFCGVCGLKTTENRVPRTGHIPEPPGAPKGVRHMGVIGPITRCVADLELILRLISGPDGVEWEVPPAPLSTSSQKPLNKIQFAWTDQFDDVPVAKEIKLAIEKLAVELEKLGCKVEKQVSSDFDFPAIWELWGELFSAEVGSTMTPEAEAERAKELNAGDLKDIPLLQGYMRGVGMNLRNYTQLLTKRDKYIGILERFFEEWDVLLCPVSSTTALRHCPTTTPVEVDGRSVPYWMAGLAHCAPFNVTGHPSVIIPLAFSSEGLPIGIQIVGKLWGEAELLVVTSQLERMLGLTYCPYFML